MPHVSHEYHAPLQSVHVECSAESGQGKRVGQIGGEEEVSVVAM